MEVVRREEGQYLTDSPALIMLGQTVEAHSLIRAVRGELPEGRWSAACLPVTELSSGWCVSAASSGRGRVAGREHRPPCPPGPP